MLLPSEWLKAANMPIGQAAQEGRSASIVADRPEFITGNLARLFSLGSGQTPDPLGLKVIFVLKVSVGVLKQVVPHDSQTLKLHRVL